MGRLAVRAAAPARGRRRIRTWAVRRRRPPNDGRRRSWKSWPASRRLPRRPVPWASRRCIIICWSGTRCRDWWRPARRAPRALRLRGRNRSWFGCGASWTAAAASASGKRPWCVRRSGRWGFRPGRRRNPKNPRNRRRRPAGNGLAVGGPPSGPCGRRSACVKTRLGRQRQTWYNHRPRREASRR